MSRFHTEVQGIETMKKLVFAAAMLLGCCGVIAAQQQKDVTGANITDKSGKPFPSPRKLAEADLKGTKLVVSYGAPSVKGRKIMGGVVPYTEWWRTGANEATAFQTTGDVMIGNVKVPAGKYTLVTLPSEGQWQLVICKHTGQWGTERHEADDLGKVPMMKVTLPSSQEVMSISFEKTSGAKTMMHIRWEKTDVSVPVSAM